MGQHCCVKGCSSRSSYRGKRIANGIKFFSFPTWKRTQGELVSDVTKRRRTAWVAAVRRPNVTFDDVPRWITICCRHFHSGRPAYEMEESNPDWAPSLHLGHTEVKETNPARYERQKRRADLKKQMASGDHGAQLKGTEKNTSFHDHNNQLKETEVKIEIDAAEEPGFSAAWMQHQPASQGTSRINSDDNFPKPDRQTNTSNPLAGPTASKPIRKTVHWINTKPIEESATCHQASPEPTDHSERTDNCQWIKIEEVEENVTSDVLPQFQFETTDNSERHLDVTDINTEPPTQDTDSSAPVTTAEMYSMSDEDSDLQVTFTNSVVVEGASKIFVDKATETCDAARSEAVSVASMNSGKPMTSSCAQKHGKSSSTTCQVPGSDQPATSDKTALSTAPRRHKCLVCFRTFSGQLLFRKHMFIHAGQKPLVCDVCGKAFRQSSTLNQHKLIHSNQRPFVCDVCSMTFGRLSNLNRHKLTHSHTYNKRPFMCDVCGKRFKTEGDWNRHNSSFHAREKTYKCDVCYKRFALASTLNEHKLVYCKKLFECDVCPKLFFQSDDLKRHKLIHSGPPSFTCSVCNKSFKQSTHLKSHMLVHSEDRPFKCDECDKSYKFKNHLKDHKLLHTGEKPFICELCGMCFAKLTILRQHIKNHSDHRPFVCDVCSKGFKSAYALKIHLSIHTKQ